jgi:hypothetical protein
MGEHRVVTVKRELSRSLNFEWCEWEERPGTAPSVPTMHYTEAESRQ